MGLPTKGLFGGGQSRRTTLLEWLERRARSSTLTFGAAIVAMTLVLGYIDFATGPNVLLSAFYAIPVFAAAWTLGLPFALAIAVLSVAVWAVGDIVNGDAAFADVPLAGWNSAIKLAELSVMAIAFDRLRAVQRGLEARVRERTDALERAQHDLVQSSEREQRRIGQDLHDGLCQHLAGTAFLCEALHQDLAQRGLPEAARALRIVDLVKEGVVLSRQTAKGLDPVDIGAEGLMEALDEFAAATGRLFDVACRFECDSPVPVRDGAVAGNLFRIAQEAVRNAIQHGKALHVAIVLCADEDGVELRIEDDGIGIASTARSHRGMGMTIMPRRAAVIGASFEARPRPAGGTIVCCRLPAARLEGRQAHEDARA